MVIPTCVAWNGAFGPNEWVYVSCIVYVLSCYRCKDREYWGKGQPGHDEIKVLRIRVLRAVVVRWR
jgi:hypothetical protein